jgi:hypothetical protein
VISAPKRINGEKGDRMKPLLLLLLAYVGCAGSADAYTFSWKANPEPDLAGYRLFMKVGPCLNNPNLFYKKKTVGLVTSTTYPPLTPGPNCFGLKAFNKAGLVSKMSNKVQK